MNIIELRAAALQPPGLDEWPIIVKALYHPVTHYVITRGGGGPATNYADARRLATIFWRHGRRAIVIHCYASNYSERFRPRQAEREVFS